MHTAPEPLVKTFERRDPRLGRIQVLDARSLPYMIERIPIELQAPLRSVVHERPLGILQQFDLGSCTGQSGTGWLGSKPSLALKRYIGEQLNVERAQAFAVNLYSEATTLDPFPGVYPPEDTGSSGLAICKALKRRGLCRGYRHASSLAGFIRLLQDAPVLLGMPWYDAFFEPVDGQIDRDGWQDSEMMGGHEVLVRGVDLDPDDLASAVFLVDNSWGTDWGIDGRFTFSGATYLAMRDDCDLKQPLL